MIRSTYYSVNLRMFSQKLHRNPVAAFSGKICYIVRIILNIKAKFSKCLLNALLSGTSCCSIRLIYPDICRMLSLLKHKRRQIVQCILIIMINARNAFKILPCYD